MEDQVLKLLGRKGYVPLNVPELLRRLHDESGITLVLVTHEMREIARMVNHLIIIDQGEIVADGAPGEIFKKQDWVRELGLGIPPFMELMSRLKKRGIEVRIDILDLEDATKEILRKIIEK